MGADLRRPGRELDPAVKTVIDALARSILAEHRAAAKAKGEPKP